MTNANTYQATSAYDVGLQVLSAAAVAVSGSAGGPIQRVEMHPGAEVAWDDCNCGLLALWTPRRYFSRGALFSDANDQVQNCQSVTRVVQFSLVILRCVPIPDDNGNPPTAADLTAAYAIQEDDAYTVLQSTMCVMTSLDNTQIGAFVINDQVTLGPLGACAGTQLNFSVGFWRAGCGC